MEIFNPTKGVADLQQGQEDDDALLKPGAMLKGKIISADQQGRVNVKIGPRILNAILSKYIEPGEEVKLKVVQTNPVLILEPEVKSESNSESGWSTRPPAEFNPRKPVTQGARIMAKILDEPVGDRIRIRLIAPASANQTLPDNTVFYNRPQKIQVKTKDVTARLVNPKEAGLKPGEIVRFQVAESFPRLVLQLEKQPVSTQRTPLNQVLSSFLASPEKVENAADDLLNMAPLLKDLPPDDAKAFIRLLKKVQFLFSEEKTGEPDFQKKMMNFFGLSEKGESFKQDIAELWDKLWKSPNLEKHIIDRTFRNLLDGVIKLNDAVDQVHTINQEIQKNDQVFFSFPLNWQGESGRGEMLLTKQEQESDRKDDSPYKIALLLNLTRLGRLKVDLLIGSKTLEAMIWTEKSKARSVLNSSITRLKKSLETRGFKVKSVIIRSFPAGKRQPETLAETLVSSGRGLINVKV